MQLVTMGNLETDFAALLQSHVKRNLLAKEQADLARKEAVAATSIVADFIVNCVNGGVQEVFTNENRIEQEARALKVTIQRFTQQSNQWLTLFQTFDSALKEIGDFENWIKVIERDCEIIGTTLREVAFAPQAPR